jgi:hypothetical protein
LQFQAVPVCTEANANVTTPVVVLAVRVIVNAMSVPQFVNVPIFISDTVAADGALASLFQSINPASSMISVPLTENLDI